MSGYTLAMNNNHVPVPVLWKVYGITQISPLSDFDHRWLTFLPQTMAWFNLPKFVEITSRNDPVLDTIKFHEGRAFYTDFVIVKRDIGTDLQGSVVCREDFVTRNAPPPDATTEQIDEYWNKISSYYGDNVLMVEVYDHHQDQSHIGYAFVPSQWFSARFRGIHDMKEQFSAAFLYNSSDSVEEAVSKVKW